MFNMTHKMIMTLPVRKFWLDGLVLFNVKTEISIVVYFQQNIQKVENWVKWKKEGEKRVQNIIGIKTEIIKSKTTYG